MYNHKVKINLGKKGDISYIQEELDELSDAHIQNVKQWQLIESADVIIAIGKFSQKHLKLPLLLVIILAYIRMVYKPIRNKILDLMKVQKSKLLGH